jgi:antitoxin (DNA-binding transcriptional repressor) of toxin-antitoxin stability system
MRHAGQQSLRVACARRVTGCAAARHQMRHTLWQAGPQRRQAVAYSGPVLPLLLAEQDYRKRWWAYQRQGCPRNGMTNFGGVRGALTLTHTAAWRLCWGMTAARSFELPPRSGAPAEVVDAAVDGQVVYLMRDGQPVAAVVPADVATAGAAAVEALEEAEDVRAARAARAGCAPRVPLSEVLAEYADDLAAYPDVAAR